MRPSSHSMTVEREEAAGTLTEWYIWFKLYPPSGDGWHDPIDPGGVEFEGVTESGKKVGGKVPDFIWEWAEEEFGKRIDEATTIAHEDHDYARDYAAEMRAERRREDRE